MACAHGEAPARTLACDGAPVAIAPFDDSVDANLVRIEAIEWFREGSWITKRVTFAPGIILRHNPTQLDLLTDADREMSPMITASCDGLPGFAS